MADDFNPENAAKGCLWVLIVALVIGVLVNLADLSDTSPVIFVLAVIWLIPIAWLWRRVYGRRR